MNEHISQSDIKQELLARKEVLLSGVPTVIKIGGSIAVEADTTLRDIAFLHREIGIPLVIVHGGSPEINKALEAKGVKTQKVDGLRVTDSETLKVVVDVLNGINAQMVESLQNLGVNSVGYDSKSGFLEGVIGDPRLGYVGAVSFVDRESLRSHNAQGIVPVIAPIALMQGKPAQFLNINGDTAAGAIAASLRSHLVLATDVSGVLVNGITLPQVNSEQYRQMYEEGIVTSGMIPKLQAGLQAVHSSGKAIICQGRDLLYAFGENPRGTVIV